MVCYYNSIAYNENIIEQITSQDSLTNAYYETIDYLNNWKNKIQKKYGKKKPVFIIICSSGGGLRSALWSFRNLQILDSISNGHFKEHIGLITGASGGLIGTSYFRELMLAQKNGKNIDLYSPIYYENIAKDLLNAIFFSTTVNFFYPLFSFELNGKKYKKDVGYSFEKRLVENLDAFHNKTIADYYKAEHSAKIPLLILSPTIITDGRQLLCSSHNVAYLANSMTKHNYYKNEISGTPFLQLFKKCDSHKTLFTSLLRANACFPGVIPVILLPTNPPTQIMDAGLYDNFGLENALKFIYAFRSWLMQNTKKIIIVQLRDTEQRISIKPEKLTLWNKFKKIFTGTYSSFTESRDYQNDWLYTFVKNCLKNKVELIELEYYNDSDFNYASLSFHLVSWEKKDILKKVYSQKNYTKIKYLTNQVK